MTTTCCPFDGQTRVVVEREADAVLWSCPVCGLVRETLSEGERW